MIKKYNFLRNVFIKEFVFFVRIAKGTVSEPSCFFKLYNLICGFSAKVTCAFRLKETTEVSIKGTVVN